MNGSNNDFRSKTFTTTNIKIVVDDPLSIQDSYISKEFLSYSSRLFEPKANVFVMVEQDDLDGFIRQFIKDTGKMSASECLKAYRKLIRELQALQYLMSQQMSSELIDAFCEMVTCIARKEEGIPDRRDGESCQDFIERLAEDPTKPLDVIWGPPILVPSSTPRESPAGSPMGATFDGQILQNNLIKHPECAQPYKAVYEKWGKYLLEFATKYRKFQLYTSLSPCASLIDASGCPIGEGFPEITDWEKFLIDNGFYWMVNPSDNPQAVNASILDAEINAGLEQTWKNRQSSQSNQEHMDSLLFMSMLNGLTDQFQQIEKSFSENEKFIACIETLDDTDIVLSSNNI
jgi:hypothetical protein